MFRAVGSSTIWAGQCLMLTRRGDIARIRVTSTAKCEAGTEGEEEATGQQAEHEEGRMTNRDEFLSATPVVTLQQRLQVAR